MTTTTQPPIVTLTPEQIKLCEQVARADFQRRRAILQGWLEEQAKHEPGSTAANTAAALIELTNNLVEESLPPRRTFDPVLARAKAKQQRARNQGLD